MVRTPPPPPATGAQIQGRITDLMKRTAGKVTVQIVDEKGQAVAESRRWRPTPQAILHSS